MSSQHLPRLVTATVYNDFLQIKKLCGDTKTPFPANTTINERLDILKDAPLGVNESPEMRYLVIGDKGHWNEVMADGGMLTSVYDRESTDGGPFGMIPWVIRDQDDDLPVESRSMFALRILKEVNGSMKWHYYALRFDPNKNPIEMIRTIVRDGVKTPVPFVPSYSNLVPTPRRIVPDEAQTTNADIIECKKNITIEIGVNLVEELFHVAELLYGDRRRAIISEIGICTGVDKEIQTTTSAGTQIRFKDAIMVQVIALISTNIQFQFQNNGFDLEIEVGTNTPALTAQRLDNDYMSDVLVTNLEPRVNIAARITPK